MSREIATRYIVGGKIRDALTPEIVKAAFRVDTLVEQMLANENPEINRQRLQEIQDACMAIRVYAEKL